MSGFSSGAGVLGGTVEIAEIETLANGTIIIGDGSGAPTTLAAFSSGTGTLKVANGGTGAATLTGVLVGNGTSAVSAVTAPSGAIVGDTDTQTLSAKTLTAPKLANGGFIADASGNEVLVATTTASAITYVGVTPGATTVAPAIKGAGETNTGLLLAGSGTGKIRIGDGADNTKLLTFELVGATTAKTMTVTSSHTDDRTVTLPDA